MDSSNPRWPAGEVFLFEEAFCILRNFGKYSKKPLKPQWYAVEARFVIQIEGRKKGILKVENRVLVVKALYEADAVKKLRMEFKRYQKPYLNSYKEKVRWKFEKILNVQQIMGKKIDPEGTEVFSYFHFRRMKPKDRWFLRTKMKK